MKTLADFYNNKSCNHLIHLLDQDEAANPLEVKSLIQTLVVTYPTVFFECFSYFLFNAIPTLRGDDYSDHYSTSSEYRHFLSPRALIYLSDCLDAGIHPDTMIPVNPLLLKFKTPLLHRAIMVASTPGITMLLKRGASISTRDSEGRGTLYWVSAMDELPQTRSSLIDITTLLIEAGADPFAPCYHQLNAIEVAVEENEEPEIAHLMHSVFEKKSLCHHLAQMTPLVSEGLLMPDTPFNSTPSTIKPVRDLAESKTKSL